MIDNENTKKVWRYGACAYGIPKRGRKMQRVATDKAELGETQDSPCPKIAEQKARDWAAKNMKSITQLEAKATLWEVEGNLERWEPFTKEHNLSWSVNLSGGN